MLIYPSEDGKINIYAQGETGNVHVSIYSANGINVFSKILPTTNGSTTLDVNGKFAQGMYIVKVEGVKARGSNTLTIH